MKILTPIHPVEIVIGKIEMLLEEHHMTLTVRHDGNFVITRKSPLNVGNGTFIGYDTDNHDVVNTLPRLTDSEKFVYDV